MRVITALLLGLVVGIAATVWYYDARGVRPSVVAALSGNATSAPATPAPTVGAPQ